MSERNVDSGGNVHGPMDQRHTARLGNISRSGHLIPGSRHYLGENWSSERVKRRQSDSNAWDSQSESKRGEIFVSIKIFILVFSPLI
ncbi:unnamed protein product [Trichobilharzia regenti]|nr:unnamed protein product [Trichobilharzia regenti]